MLEIRQVTPADITPELLAALGPPTLLAEDPRGCLDRARAVAVAPDRYFGVALYQGRPVGSAEAQDYGLSVWRGFNVIRLHDIRVVEEHRRRGIARRLFADILAWATARPHPGFLEWQASAAAVPFYRALGMEPDYVSDVPRYPYFIVDLRTGQPVAPDKPPAVAPEKQPAVAPDKPPK